MEEEKYYLVLTGDLSEGQNREEAESALGRLLRMPSEKAGSLLRGKPLRIQKSLAGDKAQHLLEKVLACGVGCRLEQVVPEQTSALPAERRAPGMRGRPLSRRLTTGDKTAPVQDSAQDPRELDSGSAVEFSGHGDTELLPATEVRAETSESDTSEPPPATDPSLELEFTEEKPVEVAETRADQDVEPDVSREATDSTQDNTADLSLEWESMPAVQEKPAEDETTDEEPEQEPQVDSQELTQELTLELKLVEPEQEAAAESQPDELTLDPEPPREDEAATDPASAGLDLELDLEQSDTQSDDEMSEEPPEGGKGEAGLAASMSEIVLESPAPLVNKSQTNPKTESVPEVYAAPPQFFEQPESVPAQASKPEKKDAGGLDRKWIMLAGILVLIVLAAGAWLGMGLFSSGDKKPAAPGKAASSAVEKKVQPKGPAAVTKKHQEMLARSVKIWMIQYGAGFDPGQVTLAALEQDLRIPPGEFQDGWGTPFRYQPRADRYLIISAGPDRQFDTADDLSKEVKIDAVGGPVR